jgi:hypothetical protein
VNVDGAHLRQRLGAEVGGRDVEKAVIDPIDLATVKVAGPGENNAMLGDILFCCERKRFSFQRTADGGFIRMEIAVRVKPDDSRTVGGARRLKGRESPKTRIAITGNDKREPARGTSVCDRNCQSGIHLLPRGMFSQVDDRQSCWEALIDSRLENSEWARSDCCSAFAEVIGDCDKLRHDRIMLNIPNVERMR